MAKLNTAQTIPTPNIPTAQTIPTPIYPNWKSNDASVKDQTPNINTESLMTMMAQMQAKINELEAKAGLTEIDAVALNKEGYQWPRTMKLRTIQHWKGKDTTTEYVTNYKAYRQDATHGDWYKEWGTEICNKMVELTLSNGEVVDMKRDAYCRSRKLSQQFEYGAKNFQWTFFKKVETKDMNQDFIEYVVYTEDKGEIILYPDALN